MRAGQEATGGPSRRGAGPDGVVRFDPTGLVKAGPSTWPGSSSPGCRAAWSVNAGETSSSGGIGTFRPPARTQPLADRDRGPSAPRDDRHRGPGDHRRRRDLGDGGARRSPLRPAYRPVGRPPARRPSSARLSRRPTSGPPPCSSAMPTPPARFAQAAASCSTLQPLRAAASSARGHREVAHRPATPVCRTRTRHPGLPLSSGTPGASAAPRTR